MNRPLTSLLNDLGDCRVHGSKVVSVSGITSDSRRVVPGMAFVAVEGTSDDGHRYVGEAIERGASVVVGKEPDVAVGKRTFVQVGNPRLAVSRLAASWYEWPSREMEVVGITGTNGKTSVSFMLRHIIRSHGDSCGLIGTVRYEIGDRHIPASRTTPDAVELQRLLSGMRNDGCKKVVMEVSSHALQQQRVADVEFNLGAFTNLTRDHLDYHLNMESYYSAKKRLFERVVSLDCGRGAVINMDDEYGRRLATEIGDLSQIPYGMQDPRSVRFSAIGMRQMRTSTNFVLLNEGEPIEVCLPMVGAHNVQNCLAAVALGVEMGYDAEAIAKSMASLPSIPGRLE
ncbi:MAG: UDP-N-acetylmuramoyl-L-alanyl-D-glutamate--2,6-diaminopimelate ligase, partial [Verrucomicrobia bacterium]|nr:UDP-N-acetylmuramoyl-L-alanyl-D-glutamate--2,6-diaminopimelate ligase [Verrucomicrobiota bacterium]